MYEYDPAKIDAATRALAKYLFGEENPTSAGLDEVAAPLRDTHDTIVTFFLNLSLMVQWRGNGIGATFLHIKTHPHEEGALVVDLQVYDEHELLPYMQSGLEDGGLTKVRFVPHSGRGGTLYFTVPAELVQRLRVR